MPPERLVYLVDAPAEGDERVTGKSTREEIGKALRRHREAGDSPTTWCFVMLIGHRQLRRAATPKFNLPGPDMTPADFDAQLKKLPTKQIVFVNTASASGPFVEELSGPGRTIVTATRNGAEQLRDALRRLLRRRADVAKRPTRTRTSASRVLEAFKYAKAEVARAYEREGLLVHRARAARRQRRQGRQPGSVDADRQGRQGGRGRCRSASTDAAPICRPIRSCARCTWSGATWSGASRRCGC